MSRSTVLEFAAVALLLTASCGGDGRSDAILPDAASTQLDPDAGATAADAGLGPVDGGALSCDYPGSAEWQGTIDGREVAAIRSAWLAIEADGAWWVVGIDEAGGHCFGVGEPNPDGSDRGLQLVFDGEAASGEYQVVPFDIQDAPVGSVWASVHRSGPDGNATIAHGISGTVSVEVVHGCATGSFDITFEGVDGASGGTLSGTFGAYSCTGA